MANKENLDNSGNFKPHNIMVDVDGETNDSRGTSMPDSLSDSNGESDSDAENGVEQESTSRSATPENEAIDGQGCDSPTPEGCKALCVSDDEADSKSEVITDNTMVGKMMVLLHVFGFTTVNKSLQKRVPDEIISSKCNHMDAIVYAIPFVVYVDPITIGLFQESIRFSTFSNANSYTRQSTICLARNGFYFDNRIQCAFCRGSVPEDWAGPLEQLHDADCTFPAGNVPIQQYGSGMNLLNPNAHQQGVNEPAESLVNGAAAVGDSAVQGIRANVQQASIAGAEDDAVVPESSGREVSSLEDGAGIVGDDAVGGMVGSENVDVPELSSREVSSVEEEANTVGDDAVQGMPGLGPGMVRAEDIVPELSGREVSSVEEEANTVGDDAVQGMPGLGQQPNMAGAEDVDVPELSGREVASLEERADIVVDSAVEGSERLEQLILARPEGGEEPELSDRDVVSLEAGAVGHTVPQIPGPVVGNYLCQKCRDRPCNVMLLPCGHLTVCEQCAYTCVKCPTCNNKIKSSQKLAL